MSKLGILGGTFNPVHLGHLLMAKGALSALQLDEVLWVTAQFPPHKEVEDAVSAEDRAGMVELAIEDEPKFRHSRMELERSGPSYTVDTLRALKQNDPAGSLTFIVGADAVPELPKWRQIDEAMSLAQFVAVPRPGQSASTDSKIQTLNVETLNVSSSDIREKIKQGESIRELVPPAVADYIAERKLYQ